MNLQNICHIVINCYRDMKGSISGYEILVILHSPTVNKNKTAHSRLLITKTFTSNTVKMGM